MQALVKELTAGLIQEIMPFSLDWQRLNNKKASRILMKIEGLNFDDLSNYRDLMDDIIDRVICYTDYVQEVL